MYFEQGLTRKRLSLLGWLVNKFEDIRVNTPCTESSAQTGPSEAATAPGSQSSRNCGQDAGSQ